MNVYAIIPARSGSKGLPDKNIKRISGRPLIDFSIKFAQKLKGIDRIFCSTDSNKYAEIAKDCGAEVPFLRSLTASDDNAMEQDILKDLRQKFKLAGIAEPDIVVWLRPTFVFRCVNDIETCIEELLNNSTTTAARTVVAAENRLYGISQNVLVPSFNDNGKSMMRRQDMEASYKVFSTDVFRFKGNVFGEDFLGANIRPIVTNSICGLDIDNDFDFEITRLLVENSQEIVNEYL